jgi:hypothetical protein
MKVHGGIIDMEKIRITIATPEEREAVSLFVKARYRKEYGTEPGDPDVYVMAKQLDAIIGAAGVDFHNAEGKLPIECLYDFNEHAVSHLTNANCVQFGRWSAKEKSDISMPLVYAVALHAYNLKKSFAFIEQKKSAQKILQRSRILCKDVPYRAFYLHKVGESDRKFYVENNPQPYLLDLAQVLEALAPVGILPHVQIEV